MPSGGLTGYPQSAALQQVGGLELVVEGAPAAAHRQCEGAEAAVRSDSWGSSAGGFEDQNLAVYLVELTIAQKGVQ